MGSVPQGGEVAAEAIHAVEIFGVPLKKVAAGLSVGKPLRVNIERVDQKGADNDQGDQKAA